MAEGDNSSRKSAARAGWGEHGYPREDEDVRLGAWVAGLRKRESPKWDSFSWLTVRALFESVNDVLAKQRPEIVAERRARWMAGQRGRTPNANLVFRPPYTGRTDEKGDPPPERAFFLVGDTGEQDASQYAVVPYLTAGATQRGPGGEGPEPEFLTIVSDVIYPAGDINEYVNGFYIPYQDFEKPIYALPGNHDWYDGLDGFMYHFCGAEPLAPEHFRRTEVRPGTRLAESLWRGGEVPHRQQLAGWRESRPWGRDATMAVQPAPYFAIDVGDLLLVAIDTGVTGEIDEEQGLWLARVSEIPKQKILLTGKPIYVDGDYHPGPIAWTRKRDKDDPDDPRRFGTVDDVVRHPGFRYLAAIGGDVHNYQRYPVRIESQDRTIHYLVSGGGGAYLSPTHRIRRLGRKPTEAVRGGEKVVLPADADRRDRPDEPDTEATFRCYPQRGDSLAYAARRAGPRIFNAVQAAAAAFVGAAALLLYAIPLPTTSRSALVAAFAALLAGGAGYLILQKLPGHSKEDAEATEGEAEPKEKSAKPKKERVRGGAVAVAAAVALLGAAIWAIDHKSSTDLLSSPRFWGSTGVALLVPVLIVATILLAHDLRGSVPTALPQLATIGAFAAAILLWLPVDGVDSAPAWLVAVICVAAGTAVAMLLLGLAREAWLNDDGEEDLPPGWDAFAFRLFNSFLGVAAPAALAIALALRAGGEWVPWLAVALVGTGAWSFLLAAAAGAFAPSRLSGRQRVLARVAGVASFLGLAAWATVVALLVHLIGDGWIAAAAVGAAAGIVMIAVVALLVLLIWGTVLRKRVIACLALVLLLVASRYLAWLPFVGVAALLMATAPLGVWGIRKGRINADAALTEIRTRLRDGVPPSPGTTRFASLDAKTSFFGLNAEETLFRLFFPYRWKPQEEEGKDGTGGLTQAATKLIAELGDSDEPPFFKHLLRVDVRRRDPEAGAPEDRELTIRCFGVTGFEDEEADPPVEDEISIPFHSKESVAALLARG